MKLVRRSLVSLVLLSILSSSFFVVHAGVPTNIPDQDRVVQCSGGGASLFGMPRWYDGLECRGGTPAIQSLEDIGIIGLNLVRMLLGVSGLVAVGFIIVGGVMMITSQGDPSGISSARGTIINAVIGLVLSLSAFSIIGLVVSALS